MIENIGCPTATIILSLNTGTRTIVYHNQKLPELTSKNFKLLNLEEYSWIHFEVRLISLEDERERERFCKKFYKSLSFFREGM